MACALGDFVDFISMQLNDAFNKEGLPIEPGNEPFEESNVRWSRPLIKQYIANALIAASAARPDLFTNPKEITLEPGCVQNVCDDGCDAFGGFIKMAGEDGCGSEFEEKDISDKFRKSLKRFKKMDCLITSIDDEEPYTPGDIKTDSMNPCLFYVTNPVPEDEDIKMIINCISYPDATEIAGADDDFELPAAACGRLRPAIYEYTMHQAWELDLKIDKQIMRTKQKEHMDNFLLFVKLDDASWKNTQKKLKDRFICEEDCAEDEGKE